MFSFAVEFTGGRLFDFVLFMLIKNKKGRLIYMNEFFNDGLNGFAFDFVPKFGIAAIVAILLFTLIKWVVNGNSAISKTLDDVTDNISDKLSKTKSYQKYETEQAELKARKAIAEQIIADAEAKKNRDAQQGINLSKKG